MIRCPNCPINVITAGSPQQRVIVNCVFNGELNDKYDQLATNLKVAESKGKVFHCPKSECTGVVDTTKFSLFALKVACTKCKLQVCSSCKEKWHEGVKCAKSDDN